MSTIFLFWNLPGRGILDGDSLVYFRNSRADLESIRWILSGKKDSLKERFEAKRIIPETNWYGKPVYRLLAMGSLFALGEKDNSLFYMNAMFGILSMVALYFLAAPLIGHQGAFYALVFWGLSPIFLWYGRSAMAHMPQLFFLIAGLAFYVRTMARKNTPALFLTGFFLGLACLTHLSTVPTVGLIFLFDIWQNIKLRNFKEPLHRIITATLPFVGVILLIELETALFIRFLGDGKKVFQLYGVLVHTSFLDQFWYNASATLSGTISLAIEAGSTRIFILDILKSYMYDVWVVEGFPRILAMLGSWFFFIRCAIRRHSYEMILISLLILIPYLFYATGWSNPSMRTILTIFPLLALTFGYCANRVFLRLPNHSIRTVISGCIILYFIYNSLPIYNARSGFKHAAQWLHNHGQEKVAVLNTRVHGDSFMEAYGIRPFLVAAGDPEFPKGAEYILVSTRNTLFNPPTDQLSVNLALKLFKQGHLLFRDKFIPVEHAFDLSRRQQSPLISWIVYKLTGKNFRRHPFPAMLLRREEFRRFSINTTKY